MSESTGGATGHRQVMVRAARSTDHGAVLAVVRAAFVQARGTAHDELDVVRRTWALAGAPGGGVFDLVAEIDGAVVGHVQAAAGTLDGRPTSVAGVAPLSVDPPHQRQGVGGALLEALVLGAEARRCPLLVVLGDPAYYGRFGYTRAEPLGITYAGAPRGDPHFQARRLSAWTETIRGAFAYAWE